MSERNPLRSKICPLFVRNASRTAEDGGHPCTWHGGGEVVVKLLSKKLDFSKVKTIQFIPGGRIRVTFTSLEYRNVILGRKTLLQVDDVHFLNITSSDDPVTTVYVHCDMGIRLALVPFGTVYEITY